MKILSCKLFGSAFPAVFTCLLALAPMAVFADPFYSITNQAGVLKFSPDLSSILSGVTTTPVPADGPDCYYTAAMFDDNYFIYDHLTAPPHDILQAALDSSGPFGGIDYYTVTTTPTSDVWNGFAVYANVSDHTAVDGFLENPDVGIWPSGTVMDEISDPNGALQPLYFYETPGAVPDNAVASIWLLLLALAALYGTARFKLIRAA
jgi:hypothetical protein